jgi:holdfast attachment protein HfaA
VTRTVLTSALGAAAIFAATLSGASAQTPERLGDFERPFGGGYGSIEDPIEASTRDANGNRLVVNGRIVLGQGSLTGGLTDGGTGLDQTGLFAVGNQLNVITQGSWNTVIIDSTQINNGDINAELNGDQQ